MVTMVRFDGTLLAQLRQRRGMTQRELGTRIGVRQKVAQVQISKWESRGVVPDANTLPLLAAVLECSMADFFSAVRDTQQNTEAPAADVA